MNQQLAKQIASVIESLQAIHATMTEQSVFPEHRWKLVESRICLSCEEPISEGSKVVRGCHEKCRAEQLDSNEPDEKLMMLGLLAPTSKTGRKPKKRLEKAIAKTIEKSDPDGKSSGKKNNR